MKRFEKPKTYYRALDYGRVISRTMIGKDGERLVMENGAQTTEQGWTESRSLAIKKARANLEREQKDLDEIRVALDALEASD